MRKLKEKKRMLSHEEDDGGLKEKRGVCLCLQGQLEQTSLFNSEFGIRGSCDESSSFKHTPDFPVKMEFSYKQNPLLVYFLASTADDVSPYKSTQFWSFWSSDP